MTVAELPAPLTKGKRWAKNAAEREQQIHGEAVAIKVRRPELFADLLQSKTPACQRGFRFCSFSHFSHPCSGKPRESCTRRIRALRIALSGFTQSMSAGENTSPTLRETRWHRGILSHVSSPKFMLCCIQHREQDVCTLQVAHRMPIQLQFQPLC